jgi:peroxiredoxin (alkyl hydroperoxide reductase subunit C)
METQTNLTSMPKIGDKAPDFKAVTTFGDLQFSDYNKGNWVVLFSHPADFTPVCTTEMSAFALNKDFFDANNTKLLGLSIDSIHSHLAWVNNVHEKTGILFNFPIIADLDMSVSLKYGMLHPGASTTAAVRAVFFIDPSGIIKLIMYYPLNIGRNMEEIKRVLIALQTAEKMKCALPVNWVPGEKAIIPPPNTMIEMEERKKLEGTDVDYTDFYLIKKSI